MKINSFYIFLYTLLAFSSTSWAAVEEAYKPTENIKDVYNMDEASFKDWQEQQKYQNEQLKISAEELAEQKLETDPTYDKTRDTEYTSLIDSYKKNDATLTTTLASISDGLSKSKEAQSKTEYDSIVSEAQKSLDKLNATLSEAKATVEKLSIELAVTEVIPAEEKLPPEIAPETEPETVPEASQPATPEQIQAERMQVAESLATKVWNKVTSFFKSVRDTFEKLVTDALKDPDRIKDIDAYRILGEMDAAKEIEKLNKQKEALAANQTLQAAVEEEIKAVNQDSQILNSLTGPVLTNFTAPSFENPVTTDNTTDLRDAQNALLNALSANFLETAKIDYYFAKANGRGSAFSTFDISPTTDLNDTTTKELIDAQYTTRKAALEKNINEMRTATIKITTANPEVAALNQESINKWQNELDTLNQSYAILNDPIRRTSEINAYTAAVNTANLDPEAITKAFRATAAGQAAQRNAGTIAKAIQDSALSAL